MKVTEVETFVLHVPIGKHIEDSFNKVDTWGLPGVIIRTDEGIEGVGYTSTMTHGDDEIVAIIQKHYAPLLLGRDPNCHRQIWEALFWSTIHWVGRLGITTMAQAAVDIALWDIKAKVAGQPLWKLVGGHKNSVPSYNTDGGWLNYPVDRLISSMGRMLEQGWRGVKMKVGRDDPREDYRRVKAVRDALGYDFDLMIDANQIWSLATARTWAPRLEEFQLTWLEEPLAPDDVRSHALLAQETRIPIALGEHIYSKLAFRDFIEAKAVQYVQADCTRMAGVTEWLDTAALCEAFNVAIVPHHADMMRVHQHLAAATAACPMIECILWLQELFAEPLDIREGVFHLPQTPGASTTFNAEKFIHYRVA